MSFTLLNISARLQQRCAFDSNNATTIAFLLPSKYGFSYLTMKFTGNSISVNYIKSMIHAHK